MSEFRWRKHERFSLEHVYTCPIDQSQGNVRRKVEMKWVQRCVSVKSREFGQRKGGGNVSRLKFENEKVIFFLS